MAEVQIPNTSSSWSRSQPTQTKAVLCLRTKTLLNFTKGNAVPTLVQLDEIWTDLDRIWNEGIDKGSTDSTLLLSDKKSGVDNNGIWRRNP